MNERGRTASKSPWWRADRRLGASAPDTTIAPGLRSLCMTGDKAISVIATRGEPIRAQTGTPLDPEDFVAWRTDAISIYFHGELPASLTLRLSSEASVVAEAIWQDPDKLL